MPVGLQEAPPTHPSFTRSQPAAQAPRHKAPLWTKICVVLGALLLVGATGTIGTGYYLTGRYEGKVKREKILTGAAAAEKSSIATGPLNFLILGSDNRAADPSVGADTTGERTDTIMLVHVNQGLNAATVVSIPRDSYVDVPAADNGSWNGGKNKINAAYAFGGARLMATAVHELTGIALNGAFILDFDSVRKLVGIVGGVWVNVPATFHSIHTDRVWKKGRVFLTADAAQDFMRQRKTIAGGDFGRIQNQQRVMMAVAQKLTSKGTLTNPLKLDRAISTVASAITADEDTNIRDLALALRGIKPAGLTFTTVPFTTDQLKTPYGESVELDERGDQSLFDAIQNDTIELWTHDHPQRTFG
jgi:LCP family protein required for cell wall assembly